MPRTGAHSGDGDTNGRPAQRGRPVGDHARKRAQLLEAATAVIAEQGYANASLRKVAHRAGYTTGAVTYYFANKAELVTALVEHSFESYDAMINAAREQADLRVLFEQWMALVADEPEFWPVMSQLLAHGRHEPALAEVIERRYARYRDTYAALLSAAQKQGTVRDDIPADLLADQLAAMGDGWMMLLPFEPERFAPDRIRALVDAAMTLIAPPPGTHRTPER